MPAVVEEAAVTGDAVDAVAGEGVVAGDAASKRGHGGEPTTRENESMSDRCEDDGD